MAAPQDPDGRDSLPIIIIDESGNILGGATRLATDAQFTGTLTVALDKDNDSVAIWGNTAKDGSGTKLALLLDANGKLRIVPSSGLPVANQDAVGQDPYVKAVDAPARVCHYLHVSVENNGAVISCDGGTTNHFYIPANTERLFPGLEIASGVEIHAKNLVGGSNFTNLRLSVW